jgi:hypothetical protein
VTPRSSRMGPGAIDQFISALFSTAMVSVCWSAHDRLSDKFETTGMPRTATSVLLLATLSSLIVVASANADVAIVASGSPLDIAAAGYEARIDVDGCLTNLRIGGHEFLAPGVSISRGAYFFQGGVLKLPTVERPSGNVIAAHSDAASIRYEFADQGMNWKLANRSDSLMVLFLVFSKDIEAVLNHDGETCKPPLNEQANEMAVILGNRKLSIHGCDKVWGPWEGPHQVCQVTLNPGDEKQVDLTIAEVAPNERQKIQSFTEIAPDPKLSILSPRAHQVFQRSSASEGPIFVSGHTTLDADAVELRTTGKAVSGQLPGQWQPLPYLKSTHRFDARLQLPAGGWYALEVRAVAHGDVVAESKVDAFGVGEVFVGAGQSNSTNCGETCTQQTSGMVSSFGGDAWRLADDPQPGVADKSQGGSFWPAFGDVLYEKFQVPIGVATTGFGGTSVSQWQPDGDLFPWMMTRIHQLGPQGFRALLWHQGESDVQMDPEEYYRKLRNVIQSSRSQAGWYVPWFVAQASYHNAAEPRFESVRGAQAKLWHDGIALEGPDTDTLTEEYRDLGGKGIHFSPKGLHAHGTLWAKKVGNYVDEVLQQ